MDKQKSNRRRGEALEGAILLAAWDELSAVGYQHLTMEGVAARAKTNKAVLYRRWPNKAKLVGTALRKYLPRPTQDVPNTGDLRTDVFTFLHGLALPLQSVGAQTVRSIVVEFLDQEIISSIPQIMHPQTEGRLITAMKTILKNAEERGEIRLENISPRVISLPLDLFRYELVTTYEPVSDQVLSEIVDDIFIPLVRAKSG